MWSYSYEQVVSWHKFSAIINLILGPVNVFLCLRVVSQESGLSTHWQGVSGNPEVIDTTCSIDTKRNPLDPANSDRQPF